MTGLFPIKINAFSYEGVTVGVDVPASIVKTSVTTG